MNNSIERPMFPPVIDSTMISAMRSCKQKMFKQYMLHYKPTNESVHLVAGAAFAKGLEVARENYYINKLSVDQSYAMGLQALIAAYGDFQCPDNSAKSLDRMLGAFEFFFANYPLDDDAFEPLTFGDKRGIEFSFAEPLDIMHPTSGDPIIFCGRADMIGEFADGIFLEDDKTTSSLGASFANQWELRSQFTGYAWAARKSLGIDVKGALIRGVSILKTKYDTMQVLTYRNEWEIDRWYKQIHRDIQSLIDCWKEGYYDYNLDYSCNEYGGCLFQSVCKSKEELKWLEASFTRKVWNPIDRVQVTPEEWEKSWQGEDIDLSGVLKLN